ncbi:MAG: PAS domain S-box protein [Magnetospirillum sp.]|nr:PAS domain S-box protein [Magnetospirillum sp.]
MAVVAIWLAAGGAIVFLRGIEVDDPWRAHSGLVVAAAALLSALILMLSSALGRMHRQVVARFKAEESLTVQMDVLRATGARFENILEAAGDGIYGVDDGNTVVFANRVAAHLLGWPSAEAMIGQQGPEAGWHLLADGCPCTAGDCLIRRTLEDGVARRGTEEFFVSRDGTRIPVDYLVSAQIHRGEVEGAVVVFREVSAQRAAEQARRERQELFEQIFVSGSVIKLLIDPQDGSIVDANPSAAEFYGLPLEDLRRKTIHDINALPVDEIRRRMSLAEQNLNNYFVARHRTADGSVRTVEVYSGPIRVQDRTLLMSIIHDVSERMRKEQELAAAHLRLKAQAKDLARSNADLEQFAYVASHDLREPLRMVSNFLTLVERRSEDKLDTESREFIGFAVDGAKRMDRLILDLLQYSRIGRLSQPMRTVVPAEALRLAMAHLQFTMDDLAAEVVVADELPKVIASEDDLIRLFQNLIGNALKYTPPGRPPRVEVGCVACDEGWRFSVRDNGIGIDPDNFERVFGIFKRLHAPGEYDGTGIGLAICRKIVERHGGRIWVESDGEGKGSTFFFTLPAVEG